MNDDLLQLYKAVELFGGLSDDQIQALVDIAEDAVFEKGQTIIDQDDEGDNLFIICRGQVEIRVRTGDAMPDQTRVYLGRGQVIGEIALLDLGRRSATVKASSDQAVLQVIERQAFDKLCNSNTEIGYVVMRNLARDLAYKLRHNNLGA